MKPSAQQLIALALVSAGSANLFAQTPTPATGAANYPTKTLRYVVAFPAGGTTDLLGRLVGQGIAARLGTMTVRVVPGIMSINMLTAAHAIALNRYRGGLATYLDVLSAEDSLIADRRTLADLETRAFTLDVALVRALGGGGGIEIGRAHV